MTLTYINIYSVCVYTYTNIHSVCVYTYSNIHSVCVHTLIYTVYVCIHTLIYTAYVCIHTLIYTVYTYTDVHTRRRAPPVRSRGKVRLLHRSLGVEVLLYVHRNRRFIRDGILGAQELC